MKSPQVKSYPRMFIKLDLSILEISCSAELTHYQMANFRLFQTESVCRQQFQISQK